MNGWEIVCPDGRVRHLPYINLGDAESDATSIDRKTSVKGAELACRMYPNPGSLERKHGPCPGGKHEVRPVVFLMPPERGES